MSTTRGSRIRFTPSLVQTTAGKKAGQACLCLVMLLCLQGRTSESAARLARDSLRQRSSLNAGWRFQKGDPPGADGQLAYPKIKNWVTSTGNEFALSPGAVKGVRPEGNLGGDIAYVQPGFDDTGWRQLNLPHDWGIEGPFKQEYPGETGKLPWWGVAWYRKHFSAPAAERAGRFYLDVDGAMAYATVWLNGKFVGGWPYGYASFELDLTPYVDFGADNVLAIRLDNPPESSRWYPGGGIYRNVWLVKTEPIHVAHWGTFVTTPQVNSGSATVDVKVTIENHTSSEADLTARTQVFEMTGSGQRSPRAVATSAPAAIKIATGATATAASNLHISAPKLWSIDRPNLYVAVVTVDQTGKPVDRYETVFGIRTIKFDPEKGFLLNGEHVRLNGVCDHHDLGPLGAAINVRALERQIEILKEMGVNAIRTSHNPPAPELLDLCDRMGVVVMDEGFDCWRRAKKRNDYHLLFDDWHEKDFRAQIRRDRNHPSVVLWSIGNEIDEQRRPEGLKIGDDLIRIVHEEDPTRPGTAACNHTEAGYNGFQKIVDVFGYNYKPGEYGKFRDKNHGIFVFGSETASCVSSRGEYFFPVSDDKSKGMVDFQVSSYDLYAPPWATPPDTEFKGQDQYPFVAGEFVWTGFDYIGEPTPYGGDRKTRLEFSGPAEQARKDAELKQAGIIRVPSRSSYFGIVDLCGFKKDRFYLYQARWRPDLPMAHILPHWNWPDRVGQVTPVHIYTSGDEAELFLNGKSLGRKKKEPYQYRIRWDDVKYEPGELRVIAYKGGRKWAEAATRTTGPASKLTLKADRPVIKADGQDLSFVTVAVADKDGQPVPRSKNRIHFDLSGPGEIVGIDNGDATSLESLQAPDRSVYNGLCLVVVRAKAGNTGKIILKAQSDGLTRAEIPITAR